MNLVDEAHEDVLVVRVRDTRSDASRAPKFKDEITKRVEAGRTKLVLDPPLLSLSIVSGWERWCRASSGWAAEASL
jgi:hypothetical protein